MVIDVRNYKRSRHTSVSYTAMTQAPVRISLHQKKTLTIAVALESVHLTLLIPTANESHYSATGGC